MPEGYTATVTREGTTFVLTNTLDTDKPEDPKTPEDPQNPDNPPVVPGTPADPQNPSDDTTVPGEPVEEPLGDAPDTGDTNNAVPYVVLMLAAAAGLVLTRRSSR